MYLIYKPDPVDPTLIHFRIDSLQSNWMSLMITQSWEVIDYADSATSYVDASNGHWTLFDQFEHNFIDNPLNDTHQDLLFGAIWTPFAGALSASWSRKFMTGDTAQDLPFAQNSTLVPRLSLQLESFKTSRRGLACPSIAIVVDFVARTCFAFITRY